MENEIRIAPKKNPKLRLYEIADWYNVSSRTLKADIEANAECKKDLTRINCDMKGFYPAAQAIIIYHLGNPFGSIEDLSDDLRKRLEQKQNDSMLNDDKSTIPIKDIVKNSISKNEDTIITIPIRKNGKLIIPEDTEDEHSNG